MALLKKLPTFEDNRGSLTVIEKEIPFKIKRIYYLYKLKNQRGGHRHNKNIQAIICLNGMCIISNNNGSIKDDYLLDRPDKLLIINPEDWHIMHSFSEDAILLVLASEYYDPDDYIYEEYNDPLF